MIIVFFSFKENISQILGGTIVLIVIPPLLLFFSVWFKRYAIELNFMSLIVLGILGCQYINYYDVTKNSYNLLLLAFVLIVALIFALMAYILIKPFHTRITSSTEAIRKEVEKSIKFRYYYLAFNAISMSYVFGKVISFSSEAPLIQEHVISFVQVGILTLIISNLVSYITFRGIRKYLSYAYQKREINIAAIRKFAIYLLVITVLVGIIVEILTRNNIILFGESYFFLLISVLLIWQIYQAERLGYVTDTKELSVDEITVNYKLIMKYMIRLIVIDSICLISFALLL